MKFYLISDNTDTYVGMRMAGLEGCVVHEAEEVVLQKYILRPPEPEVIAEMEDPNR